MLPTIKPSLQVEKKTYEVTFNKAKYFNEALSVERFCVKMKCESDISGEPLAKEKAVNSTLFKN